MVFIGEADKPLNLVFPSTVGIKWGGLFTQDGASFNFSGWTPSATITGTATLALTVTLDGSNIYMTVPKAFALANAGTTCAFVMQAESGGIGVVIAYGEIYFTPHPTV